MKHHMKGKIVVVTGATSGIGEAAAYRFAGMGARVVCVARRKSAAFDSVCADLTDETQVQAAVDEIIAAYGRVDILINNAGGGISGPVEDAAPADVRRLFDLNFFGALCMIRAVLPHMRKQGRGVIINVSSVAAEFAIPFQAFYSASKAALSSLSEALRCEVSPFGIHVSCVLPGDVKTAFTASRQKSIAGAAYGDRAARAVAAMERDERRGMPPEKVAKAIAAVAKRRDPPVKKVVGAKYKCFVLLARLLPSRLINCILAKMYG